MPEIDPGVNRRQRFQQDPPADRAKLEKAWRLLEGYSRIPADVIEPHLRAVRDKAWAIFPYGCLGRWRFLDMYITTLPEYPELLTRTRAGATLLDCGCCLGQTLRQLAHDGAPQRNLVGTDLRPEFIDLGYDLFRDRETFGGKFVTGSMLDPEDAGLKALDGTVDIIHAASFFHLFGWEDQVVIGVRMVRFFKDGVEGATVLGRQIGNPGEVLEPEEHARRGLGRYHHNRASMQRLWDVVGARTGTEWKVEAELETVVEEAVDGNEENRTTIRFVVRKV
ncbi:hypothetical protein B0T22DRAFT_528349 [Podospora appendiculata]|uniref:Methyltransferase domain-containing protein n=1 Tax=Podospora appendiculata TaxID=314037 RepID=A0AAE0XAW8_9PEZI|nr:hypothetical protein B0T22DRAFT_528349 [Podospora appendiculata]